MQIAHESRRARRATMVAFATNGALPATLLARYAEVKASLGVDAGTFGLIVATFMVGAAATFHLPGACLRRWGSKRVTSVGTFWIALAFLLATLGVTTGAIWLFALGLFVAGLGDAVVDVAQNSQGLRVQHAYRRSLLSSMHAGWSLGAASGGLIGTLAASAGVPLLVHLAIWGAVCTLSMGWASRHFLPDHHPHASETQSGRMGAKAVWLLLPLALVALAGIAVEDVGNNWSAVLLATERDMPATAAGIGLTVLLAAQFIGRLLGDRFIDLVGNRSAVITSLGLIVFGLNLAAWAPWASLTIVGFAVAGLGCAVTVPLAFAGADALPGLKAHAGVTWVNWMMRAVTIVLTPLIGGITTAASLPVAITGVSLIAIAALVVQLAGNRQPPATTSRQ